MIKAKDLSLIYEDGTLGLKDINMDIESGQIVYITGPSGSGKTTLLQIMGTLDKPSSGLVEIKGQKIEGLKDKELAFFRNQQIGFIFQFHQLLPEFTAIENVMMPALIGGLNKKMAFHINIRRIRC